MQWWFSLDTDLLSGCVVVVTYASIVLVIAWVRVLVVWLASSTYVVGVFVANVTWPVLVTDPIVVPNRGSRWGKATLAGGVTSTLIIIEHKLVSDSIILAALVAYILSLIEWQELLQNIFSLTDLRAILKAVGLLDKEHVALVLRGLHYLRPGPPVLDIYPETLIRLWTDWTVVLTLVGVMTSDLILLVNLRVRSAISRPKTTKATWIHLLL